MFNFKPFGPRGDSEERGARINCVAVDDNDHIFIGTDQGLFWYKEDTGEKWYRYLSGSEVLCIAIGTKKIFAGLEYNGLYYADLEGLYDGWGLFWRKAPILENPYAHLSVWSAVIDRGRIIIGLDGDVLFSEDDGETWRWQGLPFPVEHLTAIPRPSIFEISSLLVDPANPNRIFAGTVDGMFQSSDGGRDWQWLGPKWVRVWSLAMTAKGDVLAGTDDGILGYSQVTGWSHFALEEYGVPSLVVDNDCIFAATVGVRLDLQLRFRDAGACYSGDNGQSWECVKPATNWYSPVITVACTSTRLLAGTDKCGLFSSDLPTGGGDKE